MDQDWKPMHAPRYSKVPWLDDRQDLRAMGPPESSVEVGLTELTLGLYVPHPFGKGTEGLLCIHAITGNGNDGGTITLAISDVVYRREEETYPPKPKITKASFYPPLDDNGSNEPDGD